MRLLSCTYFSSFFAASAWTEESSKSNTILDLANSACETHISIHAPMKGATEHDISVTSVPLISIRTPTKGATIKSPNSKLFFIISIHAPAKGATQIAELGTTKTLFQSTLPRRERPDAVHRRASKQYFNPRSREGSDAIRMHKTNHPNTFQSTLPRRERLLRRDAVAASRIFQSTLPRRERHSGLSFRSSSLYIFQSTLPRRERLDEFDKLPLHLPNFNPRSREGSDQS